jgi:hypothetical protein
VRKISEELDYARTLVGQAIHAPDPYIDAITLACAVTHRINDLFSAPRVLALGPPGSGKSTLLTVASYLANCAGPPTGVLSMTAPSYVAEFRLNPAWTPCIDEISQLFGEAGSQGKGSRFYSLLNQGYRRDTAFSQCQENKVTLRIPIFGVAFLAGLGLAAPPDLRDRSIILHIEKAPAGASVADFSDPATRAQFAYANRLLGSWMLSLPGDWADVSKIKGLHPKLAHRTMDVWGSLFMVARAAGGDWPKRVMTSFERIELDAALPVYLPEVQLQLDYLRFSELNGRSDSISSGEFAQWATTQEHGAYMGFKPAQFREFVVGILGPTVPYLDNGRKVRGWDEDLHGLNLLAAQRTRDAIEEKQSPTISEKPEWEDFLCARF